MQRNKTLQIIGQLDAVLGLPFRVEITLRIMRMPYMIGSGQKRKDTPVVYNSADTQASEPDPVISSFPAD